MEPYTPDDINYIRQMDKACKEHEEWLAKQPTKEEPIDKSDNVV